MSANIEQFAVVVDNRLGLPTKELNNLLNIGWTIQSIARSGPTESVHSVWLVILQRDKPAKEIV